MENLRTVTFETSCSGLFFVSEDADVEKMIGDRFSELEWGTVQNFRSLSEALDERQPGIQIVVVYRSPLLHLAALLNEGSSPHAALLDCKNRAVDLLRLGRRARKHVTFVDSHFFFEVPEQVCAAIAARFKRNRVAELNEPVEVRFDGFLPLQLALAAALLNADSCAAMLFDEIAAMTIGPAIGTSLPEGVFDAAAAQMSVFRDDLERDKEAKENAAQEELAAANLRADDLAKALERSERKLEVQDRKNFELVTAVAKASKAAEEELGALRDRNELADETISLLLSEAKSLDEHIGAAEQRVSNSVTEYKSLLRDEKEKAAQLKASLSKAIEDQKNACEEEAEALRNRIELADETISLLLSEARTLNEHAEAAEQKLSNTTIRYESLLGEEREQAAQLKASLYEEIQRLKNLLFDAEALSSVFCYREAKVRQEMQEKSMRDSEELARLGISLQRLREEVSQFESSTSWKISKPIRSVGRRLKALSEKSHLS